MKVLLVDDSKTMRLIVKRVLEESGIPDVVEAANGREALSRLVNTRYDLIILDVHMPEMGGVELLGMIKESTHEGTPVIMVTSDSECRTRISKLGADICITKPFTREKLAAAIASVCKIV